MGPRYARANDHVVKIRLSETFTVSGASFAGFTAERICDAVVARFQRVGADSAGGDMAAPIAPVRVAVGVP